MKTRKKLSSRQLLIIVALGIALACLAGVLNGVYTLGQLASDTDVVAASLVASKVERAELYGYTAVACIMLSLILLFVEMKRSAATATSTD
ncbi:hypothetical protein [Corynebacterium sp. J010B-136]|uniref:hypothetical protein n=1 Tax=Corynebacterium sp. J010B-136 TaxID=2099401 RepID=UPI000CF8D9BC|nr:hypothetical protein [Corynebacterium sp. J010B-136]PQM74830.1 hypothetical protein C5Y44_03795 [Corynebacterium sp. J010B-136]